MASQGPTYAGAGANDTVSGLAWTSPGNITASDDARASVTVTSGGLNSDRLMATAFGFTIPGGATINGVVVEIEHRADLSPGVSIIDGPVRLLKGGVVSGTDQSSSTAWTTGLSDETFTYGSSSDLWGLALAETDVNASSFGVSMQAKCTGGAGSTAAYVDAIRITVYYTAAAPAPVHPPPVVARRETHWSELLE
jgi:hypothetical protein